MHLEAQPSSTLVAALSSRRFLAIRSFAVSGWQWFRLGAMVGFEVEEKSGIIGGTIVLRFWCQGQHYACAGRAKTSCASFDS